MPEENFYVLGEVTSQGVTVGDSISPLCMCCFREVWCGGWDVCFECRTNDCESVHPELQKG